MRKAAICSFILSWSAHEAMAQQNEIDSLDLPLKIEGEIEDPLKDATNPDLHDDGIYSSQRVGKEKKWQLDSGEFDLDSTAPHPKNSSNDTEGYSGIRLRLPTGKQ